MRIRFFTLIFLIFSTFVHAKDTQDLDIQIFKNLRCIVCQGQSIAESNSEFAQTLKIVVRDRLSKGDSEQEIYDFLSEKYGEWIVYKPRFNYLNSILWFSPYLFLVFDGFVIFKYFQKRKL